MSQDLGVEEPFSGYIKMHLASSIAQLQLYILLPTPFQTAMPTSTSTATRTALRFALHSSEFSVSVSVSPCGRLKATDEGYVEDINGILNTGDLPNLYQLEDKATIMENMANVAKQLVSANRKSECCQVKGKK